MNIFEKLFGEVKVWLNSFNRSHSPTNRATIKNAANNIVQQAGRDFINTNGQNGDLSDLEKRILRKLYGEYKQTKKIFHWKVTDAYKELSIHDGEYVGTLNDSRYIRVDGEYLMLTNDGIRYMDNRFNANRPRIDLLKGFTVSGGSGGNTITFSIKNIGIDPAQNIRWRLESDGLLPRINDLLHSLDPSSSSNEVTYEYTATDFFLRKLDAPRIIFFYADPEGNPFTSGRHITQDSRADGHYNIHSRPGEYFEY